MYDPCRPVIDQISDNKGKREQKCTQFTSYKSRGMGSGREVEMTKDYYESARLDQTS